MASEYRHVTAVPSWEATALDLLCGRPVEHLDNFICLGRLHLSPPRLPMRLARIPAARLLSFRQPVFTRTHITDPQDLGCTPMSTTPSPAGPIETALRERVSGIRWCLHNFSLRRSRPYTTVYKPDPHVAYPAHSQITQTFQPALLEVRNDSSKHAHHAPMRAIGGGAGETRTSCLDSRLILHKHISSSQTSPSRS